MARLGYENLPTLAAWRADSYLALNADQRALASRRMESLHAWHRRTQLDDYQAFLQEVQRRVAAGDVDEAQIRAWRVAAFERWKPIAEQVAPMAAEVAGTLAPAQLVRMREEIDRDNDKMRREWMPPGRADRIETRTKRYIERAELFLGSLTTEQKQFARRIASEAPDTEDVWFAQRLGRQQDLLDLLERIRVERPDDATATRWMREHLMRYAQVRDGPDRVGAESSLAAGDAMGAAMLARATPKQRQHLQRKLQEWIDIVQSLKPAQTASTPAAAPPTVTATR
ncbi:MAG: hypothetical protein EHM87_02665 [Burkholderiales bacterium]|nr:MAG: hypothetical protein EHM87_02665 [Burkholderiales bacterium]